VVSYLHPLHTEDIYVPARHGCVHEDVGVVLSLARSLGEFGAVKSPLRNSRIEASTPPHSYSQVADGG
jgi:ABC-type molybdate transport system permease subunit